MKESIDGCNGFLSEGVICSVDVGKISVCLGLYLRELLVFLIEEASLMHVKQFAYSVQNCTAKIDVTV